MTDYLHTFTLEESDERYTSTKARRGYEDSLEKSGFKKHAANASGVQIHLPHSSRVGSFDTPASANRAINAAEKAGEEADPGKFFLEASTLSAYTPLRTRGAKVVKTPTQRRVDSILTRAFGVSKS